MGFNREEASNALKLSNNDFDLATEYLLNSDKHASEYLSNLESSNSSSENHSSVDSWNRLGSEEEIYWPETPVFDSLD